MLMGHSLGAACAAAEVIANPEVQQVQLSLLTLVSQAHPHVTGSSSHAQLRNGMQAAVCKAGTRPHTISICCPQGVEALVLVAPAIVAMSLGWHERKEEAHAEAAALASGDEVAAAKAAASTAEFQSNTAGRLMCASYLLQRRSRKEMHIMSASWLHPCHPVVVEHVHIITQLYSVATCRPLSPPAS